MKAIIIVCIILASLLVLKRVGIIIKERGHKVLGNTILFPSYILLGIMHIITNDLYGNDDDLYEEDWCEC